MGTTLNREAYEKLIAEDLEWLRAQPRTLEREHIELIVNRSAMHEYSRHLSNEWVKVTPETMPPMDKAVMAHSRRHNTYIVIRTRNADDEVKWVFCSGGWIADNDITHWRTLPAPPSAQSDE